MASQALAGVDGGLPLTVVVSCPLLGAEETAAVEARLKADFLSEGIVGGSLTLSCPEERAVAEFEGTGGPLTIDELRAPDEPIDALLRVAYQLDSQLHGPVTKPTPEPPAKAETPKTPPAPAKGREAPPAQGSAARPPAPEPADDAIAPRVGLSVEHWGAESSGTLGLDLGVEARLPRDLTLLGNLELGTGWGLPETLDITCVVASLLAEKAVGFEWLAVRMGPAFSLMSLSGASLSPSRYTSAAFAGELAVVIRPSTGSLRPWLSLGVRAYSHERRVIVGEEEQLRVPRAAALLGLGLRL